MGRWRKNSREGKIKKELCNRFHEQEKITLKDATQEYYEPNSPYNYLIAEKQMKAIFGSIKRDLRKKGITFGCINEFDEHGIPRSKEEYQFMGIKGYKHVKGRIFNLSLIASSGKRAGYLTTEDSISLPKPEGINGN